MVVADKDCAAPTFEPLVFQTRRDVFYPLAPGRLRVALIQVRAARLEPLQLCGSTLSALDVLCFY